MASQVKNGINADIRSIIDEITAVVRSIHNNKRALEHFRMLCTKQYGKGIALIKYIAINILTTFNDIC